MAENGPKKNAAIEWLRGLANSIPESEVPEPRFFMDPRSLSILNMARAGANSALNWLDATHRALQGYDPRGVLEEGDIIAPLGAATMAAPFLRGAVRAAKPALNSSTLGSRNASIFDPPEVPKRAFSEDYPSGARADDTGRLTHDIEGRPLTAEIVVGRRMVGGEDEAFPPAQLDAFTEATTGLPPARVAGNTISGDAGRLVKDTDRRSGNRAYAVLINSGLSPQQAVRVLAHENAHIIDEIAGQIPIAGLNKELGQVYHDLNDATWRRGKPTKPSLQTTPEMFGYAPDKRPRELMAEAIRAYLTNPNYIKSIAPKTAARIRKFVNENEELARVIQFNADQSRSSLPGTVINAMAEPQGIRAYHGSPYDFDRFDMSKIGTGEGAQAYGYGLYFAEAEDVARSYRDALQHKAPAKVEGVEGGARYLLQNAIKEARKYPKADRERVFREWLDETEQMASGKFAPPGMAENVAEAKRLLASGEFVPDLSDAGRIYEVNIRANPDEFLDWDKPISQQPEAVEAAVWRHLESVLDQPGPIMDDVFERFERGEATGKDIVELFGDKKRATEVLREAGIPGIKYLDQGSRAAGEGTRNYVLFRDDIIDIIKKYGIAAAIATYGLEAVQGVLADMDQGFATGGAVGTGPLISDVPGRTDKHPIDVPEGAYVIPADIVSGLGEGNTLAGMRILENLFPKPLKAGKIRRHSEIPAPRNRGGLVPIAAAGGEYIIDPETVAEIGGGDINRGHQVLDEFVLRARKNIIQQMASLPPPQK